MNWTQSRDHCMTLGAHLVIINSKAEQDFVTSKVKETHWIGLNDLDTEGHWVWVNNQPLNNSLVFWMKRKDEISEPDNWTKVHLDANAQSTHLLSVDFEMDSVYENIDYMPPSTALDVRCSLYSGFSFQKQEGEQEVTSPKWTKVLLTVLSFSLVLALGGLCVLGMLLIKLEELITNYTRVKTLSIVQSCNLSVDGWIACHGKLYLFSTDKLNWSSSRDVCVSKGADLVTITNQTEQDFLVSKIKQTHWIGLNDLETEGQWVWVNNQTLNETGAQFWFSEGPTEPDNWRNQDPSGENCANNKKIVDFESLNEKHIIISKQLSAQEINITSEKTVFHKW
ncbi:hypothetical protein Q8A67_015818 [Cirrhinus molitorella]|uniref:C-type lectin domain-containing protein n=1 Tax=Cirrhinus molitorella TaxID=172907 RepID=A0AA88PU69_9TELE|nr:hypothetical protein Q8A67_015818 [Cirrhinus molitorella]